MSEIDPDKLFAVAAKAASRLEECSICGGEIAQQFCPFRDRSTGGCDMVPCTDARRIVAAFLNALLTDEIAMNCLVSAALRPTYPSRADRGRAALLAATQD